MSTLKLFQDKSIRSVWNEQEEQWYFSVIDVVAALTDSAKCERAVPHHPVGSVAQSRAL